VVFLVTDLIEDGLTMLVKSTHFSVVQFEGTVWFHEAQIVGRDRTEFAAHGLIGQVVVSRKVDSGLGPLGNVVNVFEQGISFSRRYALVHPARNRPCAVDAFPTDGPYNLLAILPELDAL